MHTHLGETCDEVAYCQEKFSCRPVDYFQEVGWMSDRAWVAHVIHFNDDEIRRLGRVGVGICHCPTSNMVLSSGQCRTKELDASRQDREMASAILPFPPFVAQSSTAQIRCCTCGHRRIEMRSSHPWLMS
jgi:hypothetical protein